MISVASQEQQEGRFVRRGLNADYYWLTATGGVYTGTLLRLCPEAVLNRYLAVTSYDSGVRRLSKEEISAGWLLIGDVAYSPLITSVETLKFQRDGLDSPGYDEWYVLPRQRKLGEVFHGNFFEFQPSAGQILTFVNMLAFVLHDPAPYMQGILDMFWSQLISIAPETFVADGRDCLTVVSRKEELILSLHEQIAALP